MKTKLEKALIAIVIVFLAVTLIFALATEPIAGIVAGCFVAFFLTLIIYVVKLILKQKSKTYLILLIIFFIGFFVFVFLLPVQETTNDNVMVATTETTTELTTTQVTQTTSAQSNTSAKVDEIARQAKADAQSVDEAKTNEAIAYIRNNYPNYFVDNETMEKTMYYGYLLEYAYKDTNITYAELGMDAYQAVKYVYRNVESVEDNATQENLKQISEGLSNIG